MKLHLRTTECHLPHGITSVTCHPTVFNLVFTLCTFYDCCNASRSAFLCRGALNTLIVLYCIVTQVNTPCLNPSQSHSIYLPRGDGRLSRPRRSVTHQDSLLVHNPSTNPFGWETVKSCSQY